MDTITQQALNQFVQQIIAGAQVGAQWSLAQAPLVVQEWLQWQLAEALYGLAIAAFVALVSLVIGIVCVCKSIKSGYRDDYSALMGISAVLLVASMLFSIGFTHDALKVHYAPRVMVLEKFADLIK